MHSFSLKARWSATLSACRIPLTIAMAVCLMLLTQSQSFAMNIERVISSKGIEAWLVEDHSVPLISVQFAFKSGSVQDPQGKEGLCYFISGTLDEGAGDLPSRQYQQRLEELASKLQFDASLDQLTGSLQTLSANKDASFELLRLALTAPRFEAPDVDRIRAQILSRLKMEAQDPEQIASQEWFKLAFGSHPYARPLKGTPESIAAITPEDLRGFVKKVFAKSNLKLAVVGDITPDALKASMDQIFGSLPDKAQLQDIPEAVLPSGTQTKVINFPVPQSVAQFGFAAMKRKDPDFIPAFIVNYIVGGGGFSSKLMQEVREKRGLAYSVYTYLYPLDKAGLLIGGVGTENKSVKQSLDVIAAELARLAAEGPTQDELNAAKQYLTGSYALRFDSGSKIANQLLGTQIEDLGIDYIDKRNSLIEAVTLDDVKRVAARLLSTKDLITTVVGQPDGLSSNGAAQPRG